MLCTDLSAQEVKNFAALDEPAEHFLSKKADIHKTIHAAWLQETWQRRWKVTSFPRLLAESIMSVSSIIM